MGIPHTVLLSEIRRPSSGDKLIGLEFDERERLLVDCPTFTSSCLITVSEVYLKGKFPNAAMAIRGLLCEILHKVTPSLEQSDVDLNESKAFIRCINAEASESLRHHGRFVRWTEEDGMIEMDVLATLSTKNRAII